MDSAFWHDKWQANQIGFHRSCVHPFLAQHLQRLQLNRGARILLPLCGKTKDIQWLMQLGYNVVGIELSELAIIQLFTELETVPTRTHGPCWTRFDAPNILIFVANFFDLPATEIPAIDAIYDRAALVALPSAMRIRYTRRLLELGSNREQLLITFDYVQDRRQGPPFAVPKSEIQQHYESHYTLALLADDNVPGGLGSNQVLAREQAWLLLPRHSVSSVSLQ